MKDKEEVNVLELKFNRVSFTNDKSMFCIGTDQGFLVCRTTPFCIFNNRFIGGGILIAQMLNMSNIIFLVGVGENPNYPSTCIIMFDDQKGKPVAQLQIGHRIKNVKANSRRLFVVGLNKIFVFKTNSLKNVGTYESSEDNEEGVCALSENKKESIFVYPAKNEGYVNVLRIKGKITSIINFCAFNQKISCLGLNDKGDLLLSSSIGGTSVLIFNTFNGNCLEEFKTGSDKAHIFSLSFNIDNSFFCCSTDTGTIHIFKTNENIESGNIEEGIYKTQSKSGKTILDKIISKNENSIITGNGKSFASCKTNEVSSFCIFNEKNEINMISTDKNGKFYLFSFDEVQGGQGKISEASEILCQENLQYLKYS